MLTHRVRPAHLTIADHETVFMGLHHNSLDLCALIIDGVEYVHWNGLDFLIDANADLSADIMVMNTGHLSNWKAKRHLNEWASQRLTRMEQTDPATIHKARMKHLTVMPGDEHMITAYHPVMDAFAMVERGATYLVIGGRRVPINGTDNPTEVIEHWCSVRADQLQQTMRDWVARNTAAKPGRRSAA